jgi:hypothetical protein
MGDGKGKRKVEASVLCFFFYESEGSAAFVHARTHTHTHAAGLSLSLSLSLISATYRRYGHSRSTVAVRAGGVGGCALLAPAPLVLAPPLTLSWRTPGVEGLVRAATQRVTSVGSDGQEAMACGFTSKCVALALIHFFFFFCSHRRALASRETCTAPERCQAALLACASDPPFLPMRRPFGAWCGKPA